MEPILRFDQVNICYSGKPAVRDISFSLEPGEILGIVGESGSGKSTIIKAAMGLLGNTGAVTKGSIWYNGKNIPDLPPKELRKLCGPELGMIFQNCGSAFCPVRTIGAQMLEAVNEHVPISKAAFEAQATEMLDKLGLDSRRVLRSYPFELSGGMNQRVGIATAMLMNPKILLADEPTSALDVSAQKQVVEEMLLLRKLYGTSIVIVTHNIGVVRAMADRVLVLKDGSMREYGSAAQVLKAPTDPYTKTLLAAVPRLRRA